MATSDSDMKLLWGRAAGMCSNSTCSAPDLTIMLQQGSYNVGEMAHVIARSPDGPRGKCEGGTDCYDNLILLCPTCHTKIDKAPEGEYTEPMLLKWKADHEAKIRNAGSIVSFSSFEELKSFVARKLRENQHLWETLGPRSVAALVDPGSNLAVEWDYRKLDTIVPNNNQIVNCLNNNLDLLCETSYDLFLAFKTHALAFERNQYGRLDTYPLFPSSFGKVFNDA